MSVPCEVSMFFFGVCVYRYFCKVLCVFFFKLRSRFAILRPSPLLSLVGITDVAALSHAH